RSPYLQSSAATAAEVEPKNVWPYPSPDASSLIFAPTLSTARQNLAPGASLYLPEVSVLPPQRSRNVACPLRCLSQKLEKMGSPSAGQRPDAAGTRAVYNHPLLGRAALGGAGNHIFCPGSPWSSVIAHERETT
ncbi:unnamed protein product, partial [Ectocarpus sp. 12 AP-2014]